MPITIITSSKRLAVQGGKRMAISAAIAGGGGGGADYRFGMSGGSRNLLLWPGASNNPVNVPIGTGAILTPAGITFIESGANSGGFATRLRAEREYLFLDTSASVQTIKFNCYGWGGTAGCTEPDRVNASTGATFTDPPWFADFTVRMPSSFLVASNGANNSAAWITADGANIDQAQPLCHSTALGDYTCQVKSNRVSISGTDTDGSHGGSRVGPMWAAIRAGEITNAITHGLTYLSHALKCVIDAHRFYNYYHSPGYTYIAKQRDGYADPVSYGGTNAYLVPGALMTLHPSYNTAVGGGNILTQVGSIIAETIKRFGLIPEDDATWNAAYLAVEESPAGSVVSELSGLGYSLDYDPPSLAGANAFYKDVRNIFENLFLVTNATLANLGGGGSPAYGTPLAP